MTVETSPDIDIGEQKIHTISVRQLITTIESRQSVLNKASLDEVSLDVRLDSVADLITATKGQLSFLAKASYAPQLAESNASVVILAESYKEQLAHGTIGLVVASPYLAYASCSELFDNYSLSSSVIEKTIHPSAVISNTAIIGENTTIGANVVIGDYVVIGTHCCINSNASIATGTVIGNNCLISSNVVIAHDIKIGNQVRIHAGASIGSEGFGFAPTANPSLSVGVDNELSGWQRIAQLGTVIIGNHVRIGANACIDRGAVNNTVIGDNVIIDNLVQIAHNVHIGSGSAIAANTGIAGSTTIGKNCIIGGAVGMTGHFELTDNVTVTAMSLVTKSITESGSYSSGMPAVKTKKWHRMVARLRMLV